MENYKTEKYFNIFEEILDWSKNLDNWERLALLRLCQKGIIDNQDFPLIYNEFKIDKELISFYEKRIIYNLDNSFIPQQINRSQPVLLQKIISAKGVNAIVHDQELNFGPKLTVVFGHNGSGKSGYARILKAACFTRSPLTIIHGNVHLPENQREPISATFILNDNSQVNFIQGKPCPQLRDNFAVFDSTCIRIYNDTETNFDVSPYGFDIFPKLVNIIASIRNMLEDEMQNRTPNLETFQINDSSSEIAIMLRNLNVDTDIHKLELLSIFEISEMEKIKEIQNDIEELNQKDTYGIMAQKRTQGQDIKKAINKISSITNLMGLEQIDEIKNKIKEVKDLRELSIATSAAQFRKEPLQPIGTNAWIKMVESAIIFSEEIFPNKPFPLGIEDARCLLCQQILSVESRERLLKFFTFINSDTEKKLNLALKQLNLLMKDMESLNFDFFTSDSVAYRAIENYDENLLQETKQYIISLLEQNRKLINNIHDEDWQELSALTKNPGEKFKILRSKIANEIRILRKHDISKEKKLLTEKLQILYDRQHLNKIFLEVKTAIENLKWIKKAQEIKRLLNHKHVTDEQKSLTQKLIGQGFIEEFKKECDELELNLPVNIRIRGSDAITCKSLAIGINEKQNLDPSEILSEGEQTAAALADFLAEISLSNALIGIIFDDPVNSMDHIRKEIIAKRLVEEANTRQVIVFTHDILFTNSLAEAALKEGADKVTFTKATISVDPNTKKPGCVDKTVFPYAYYEKASKEEAQKFLEQAKKSSGEDQKEKLILGCGSLRAAYEDFIQRQLFNDIIGRWREPIMATALNQIYYNPEINDSVVEHYQILSRHEKGHSHSAEYHEKQLDCTFLEKEIEIFNEIAKKYKNAAGAFRQQKSDQRKKVFS